VTPACPLQPSPAGLQDGHHHQPLHLQTPLLLVVVVVLLVLLQVLG
jgi:hypothetical protein